MPGRICQYNYSGILPYLPAYQLQERLTAEIAAGCCPPTLLLLEHPHTYTLGRSGKLENLLCSQEELEKRGISLYWTDRGGDITYHGPGQLVGYPLLPLIDENQKNEGNRIPRRDYIGFIRNLEQVLILALEQTGIPAIRIEGHTGVWVPMKDDQPAKIASIGIKVDANGISRHGFSLNVAPDMRFWDGIIPCGLGGITVTSIAELSKSSLVNIKIPGMTNMGNMVIDAFAQVFGFEMLEAKGLSSGCADDRTG